MSVTTGGTRKMYDNSIKCEWNATNLNKGASVISYNNKKTLCLEFQ